MREFNLSENGEIIKHQIPMIPLESVKEFIRLLKEMFEERVSYEEIYKKIDKLAGTDFIKKEGGKKNE